MAPDREIMLEDLEADATKIARMLKSVMPKGVGFTLFMFTLGEGGWMTYMSSAERADMVKALKEFLEKQETMEGAVRAHGHYDCEECGTYIRVDEDGCCLGCGRDATAVEDNG